MRRSTSIICMQSYGITSHIVVIFSGKCIQFLLHLRLLPLWKDELWDGIFPQILTTLCGYFDMCPRCYCQVIISFSHHHPQFINSCTCTYTCICDTDVATSLMHTQIMGTLQDEAPQTPRSMAGGPLILLSHSLYFHDCPQLPLNYWP